MMETDSEVAKIELSILKRADGSSTFKMGNSLVMASVYGPAPVKSKNELIDKATIQVVLESLNTPPGLAQNSMALRIQTILETVIMSTLYPRSLISINLQPIRTNEEANLFIVGFNAAIAALLDAGISLNCIPIAVCVNGVEVVYSFTTSGIELLYQRIREGPRSINLWMEDLQKSEEECKLIHKLYQTVIQKTYTPLS